MERLRIVFMGTPAFAVPALDALAAAHTVALVITQPDRPRGRGRQMHSSAVKQAARRLDLPVAQPISAKSDLLFEQLREIAPQVIVVAAFGQILPPRLLDLPTWGAINLHASLLPRYRGPAPIQWALLNRDASTGITLMRMAKGLDTGDIIRSAALAIAPEDTAASLGERLAHLGARLLIDTLPDWVAGRIVPKPQDHADASYASMLRKQDGRIDWQRPAVALDAFVRALTPWPKAYTFHGPQRLIIHAATLGEQAAVAPPGTVLPAPEGQLRVATGEGTLIVRELQGSSGKRLPAAAFLRGHALPAGTLLA
jgi:methionyl-tRNA formyltransferase